MKKKTVQLLLAGCCVGMLAGCGQVGQKQNNPSQQQTTQVQQTEADNNKEEKKEKENKSRKEKEKTEENKEVNEEKSNTEAQDKKEVLEEEKKDNAGTTAQNEENTDNAKAEQSEEKHSIAGIISEKKDFMVTLEDESKKAYALAFDEKPEGYDELKVGDNVQIEYTGELSETEAFTGKVLSIKKVEQKEEVKKGKK